MAVTRIAAPFLSASRLPPEVACDFTLGRAVGAAIRQNYGFPLRLSPAGRTATSTTSPATYYIWRNAINPMRPATAYVNENSYTNGWATLGNYTTFDDGSITVELTDLGTTGQYVAADAVRFVPC
jgi:hypothetical protein